MATDEVLEDEIDYLWHPTDEEYTSEITSQMWAELFLENKDYLIGEVDCIIDSLTAYRDAMRDNDREKLTTLLEEGKRLKEEIDG